MHLLSLPSAASAEWLDSDSASALAAGDECSSAGQDSSQCALHALQVQASAEESEEIKANDTMATEESDDDDEYDNLTLAVGDKDSWGKGTCPTATGGTCKIQSCASSRGPAECWKTYGFKCYCPSGWCADGGRCWPGQGKCMKDTGGTCAALGCKSKRGETKCVDGKCVCAEGHCAFKGTCYAVSDTGGTCSLFSCAASRGPTECVKGKCVCKGDAPAIDGICQTHR